VEANQDQLGRSAPFDLDRPHGSDSVAITEERQSDDIDRYDVTEVFLYASVFLGFLLVVAVGATIVLALRALRHW
jgi:hypothetical protein